MLASTKSVMNLLARLFMYCACGTHEKTGRLCVEDILQVLTLEHCYQAECLVFH